MTDMDRAREFVVALLVGLGIAAAGFILGRLSV